MEMQACRYHFDDGIRNGVVAKGHKFIQFITVNPDVSIKKLPVDQYRFCKELDVSLYEACDKLLSVGKRNGITKGAEKILLAGIEQSQPQPKKESDMELAIEKPSEQEVVASHAVIDKPEPVKSVGELKSGISAKEIQGMIEDGRVSREDAIAYLQQRVDAKNAVGKTANKQTVNLLYKLKTQE